MAITFNPLTRSLDNTIEGQTNLGTDTNFGDDVKLTFGVDNDLQISYDGTDNLISTSGTVCAVHRATTNAGNAVFEVRSNHGATNQVKFKVDGDGDIIIPTDTGQLQLGASQDLKIFHDSTNSIISNSTGRLELQGSELRLVSSGGSANILKGFESGGVELYFDGNKKFETITDGCTVSQNLNVGSELNLVGGSDGERYIDAQVGTGNLHIRKVSGGDANHETMAQFAGDESCKLYFDGSEKFKTKSDGAQVLGTLTATGLTSSSGLTTTGGYLNLQGSMTNKILLQGVDGNEIRYRNAAGTYTANLTSEGNGDTFRVQNEKSGGNIKLESTRLQVLASQIDFANLPTSDPSVAGRLYSDSGTVKISAG